MKLVMLTMMMIMMMMIIIVIIIITVISPRLASTNPVVNSSGTHSLQKTTMHQIEKAYDLVLQKLIAAQEVATGYRPLVLKVTKALNGVNKLMREVVDSGEGGGVSSLAEQAVASDAANSGQNEGGCCEKSRCAGSETQAPACPPKPAIARSKKLSPTQKTTLKLLKLEEEKFPLVAAIHMERIKLYQATLKASFNEEMRQRCLAEIEQLKAKMRLFENEISEQIEELVADMVEG